MEITIKPFEYRYREGVVDVLKYLWHDELDVRFTHFDWEYCGNPSHPDPLAVVAVDENDEVIGFRGWVPGVIKIDRTVILVARAADAVVSPKVRRQGVFTKMTIFSLLYLKEKNVRAIINLSSNKESNPGNRKLGWIILANKTKFYQLIFSSPKTLRGELKLKFGVHTVNLYPFIPQGLTVPASNDLSFSMEGGQLDWYAKRPYTKYVTLTAYSPDGNLDALYIVDIEEKMARLLYFYCNDITNNKKYFSLLKPYIGRRIISAWGWALSVKNRKILKNLGFIEIPFYEKIREKPPILVRCIGDTDNGNNWMIGGKDIRDCCNWSINQIDDF